MSATELLFWAAFIVGTVGALFRPIYGVFLYVLVYNLNPETQWWGSHINALGLRTSFMAAAATGLGMLLNWRRMGRHESQFPWAFRLMMLFIFYSFVVSTSGLQPLGSNVTQFIVQKLFKVYVFIFIMVRVVRTQQHVKWVLWAWLTGTIYIGFEAWSGIGIKLSGRLTGGLGGPDFSASGGLSAHMVMMLALAGYMFYTSVSWRGRILSLLAAAFAMNTIILTRTRNALPGILVLIVFGLLHLPRGLRMKCFLGIVIGCLASLRLADDGWWERMATVGDMTDPTITTRFDFWNAAVEMARDHPYGVGVGHFRRRVPDYIPILEGGRSAHSTYFQCLAELGYPGLLLFMAILAATIWHFERSRSVGKQWRTHVADRPELAGELRELLLLATANEVALVGFLTCSAFHTRMWTEGLWLLLATGCCLNNISGELQNRMAETRNRQSSGTTESITPALAAGVAGV